MFRSVSLVLAVALLGCAAPVLAPLAHAQATPLPIPATGVVQFLPLGELPGDGKTASTVVVVALRPDGQPWAGVKGKFTTNAGAVGAAREVSPGVYAASYVGPITSAPITVSFGFSGRAVDKSRVSATSAATVVPGRPTSAKLATEPKELVAGAGKSTDLTFVVLDASGRPVDGADLAVRTSAGTVPSVNRTGPGQYGARYNTQPVNYPHLGIVTYADRRNPAVGGHLVIPLYGSVDYPVTVSAGAVVSLQVGGTTYGPVTATADGKARVPIIVPAGHQTASATIVDAGNVEVRELDLRLPDTPRLLLYPLPEGIPATGAAWPVRVFVATPDGKADTAADLVFTASAGEISAPVHEGGGVWRADFLPGAPGPVEIAVALRDAGDKQKDAASFVVVAAPPASLALSAEPKALPKDGTSLAVVAELRDAAGKPVTAPTVSVTGGGATPRGEPEVVGEGKVKVQFDTRKTGPVEVLATPAVAGTSTSVDRLVIVPARERVANDGTSSTPVVVIALDALGVPVAGVPIALAVSGTDGTITESLTTAPNGVAVALYTPGLLPSIVQLRATAGERSAVGAMLQVPAQVSAIDLPPVGGADDVAAIVQWTPLVQVLRVNRATEESSLWGVAVAEPEPAAPEVAPVAAEPAPAPEVTPTPEPAVEPAPAVAVAEPAVPAPAPAVTPIVPTPPPPSPSTESHWFRGRVGYVASTYRYLQEPIGGGGQLLSDALAVGGEFGAGPAVPMGFEAHVRAFLPGVFGDGDTKRYLGFEGNYRSTYYGITAESFNGQVAPDTLTDIDVLALGRYPARVGDGIVWIGARAGFQLGDFVYFTGSVDAGEIQYQTLMVPGLSLGGEVGLDLGRVHAVVGGTQVLAYGSNPYSSGVDAHLAIDLVDHVFFDVGGEYQVRDLRLVSAALEDPSGARVEYGNVSDGHLLVVSSVGVSF